MTVFVLPLQMVALFVGMQVVCGLLPVPSAVAVLLSGAATVAVLGMRGAIVWRSALACRQVGWARAVALAAGACFGIVGFDILQEMAALPDLMEGQTLDMASTTVGVVAMAVAGPVCEELVFREGVLGGLLRSGVSQRTAIVVSAVVFGLVHVNPAQVPFATAIGLMLGCIYCACGRSVVVAVMVHVLNNSAAVWQMSVLGSRAADFKIVEWLGGTTEATVVAVASVVVCWVLLRRGSR